MSEAIEQMRQACISIVSSRNVSKWDLSNAEFGLTDSWKFSGEDIQVLYSKGFFFLLQKDVVFLDRGNDGRMKQIRTIYSCSNVPPHVTTLERLHFVVDGAGGKLRLEKTEVLVGGELAVAPTREDEFFDVLRAQEKGHR